MLRIFDATSQEVLGGASALELSSTYHQKSTNVLHASAPPQGNYFLILLLRLTMLLH